MITVETKASNNIRDIALGRKDLYQVSPDLLQVKPGWNSRDDETPENVAHIESLAQSIAAVGVKTPLTVHSDNKGGFFVTDGHCRLSAVRLALSRGVEIKSVPIQIEDRKESEADRVAGQIIRNSGKALTPLEQGNVFKRLCDLGWTEAEIAEKCGKTRAYVSDLLSLRAAPVEVVDMVRRGEVSATLANTTIREAKGDSEAAAETLKSAVQVAKAQGKSKATAKHTGKMSSTAIMALLKRVMRTAEATQSGDVVDLRISLADWQRIKTAFAIKETAPLPDESATSDVSDASDE